MKDLFAKMFKKAKDEIWTIPNMLSFLRILLIPVIIYLYCGLQNSLLTFIVVVFSSLTDVVDGFIARQFNMITDFGKFIDPVADKATQIVIIGCLVTKFPWMLLPCVVLLIKELGSLALRVVVYDKTDVIRGAHWHGKTATAIVIVTILLHLAWDSITPVVSGALIALCTAFLLFSGTMYTIEAFQIMKHEGKK